ncbi:adenylate/guanylate cyclase domain-containing protein [Antrihabitans sp. YC3-6]|uniref:Adenylate/guanylate cyclase domain-containing protein n=1 Tax=Antrihabitans stalagmiti TaxID=2799499 RepID=A0A934NX43_9NOCA|nr:adenylate/guanylate cyclase domain-containing protein [Antrihabitans stalagmiti]MBJ8342867.1 adenylate/guanylate cyclase domain-containing protein [Antrihabitans stalagmiti]
MLRQRHQRVRAAAPLGSTLLGSPSESSGIQRVRVQLLVTGLLVVTNLVGSAIVIALVSVVIPGPNVLAGEFALVTFVIVPSYIAFAFIVGVIWTTRIGIRELNWAIEDRPPTRSEQVKALTMPWRLTAIQLAMWIGGAIVGTVGLGIIDVTTIPKVAFTSVFGGVSVGAFSYLLAEFAFRPLAARALEHGDPRRIRLAGVTGRAILTWVLGTAVPVSGLVIIAIFSFFHATTTNQLAVSIVAIGGLTLLFGLLLTKLGARATVDPIRSVIHTMSKVERGESDAYVVVYDGTELGELQSGFNRMVDGLAERERIREMFGRHVGHEVAEAALRRNPRMGGEELSVAVFFIDLIGSTQLAANSPPQEVVSLLNRFFDVVVDEVDRFDGIINKFEGDAALAIFGAPVELDDPAGQALAAARAIRRRLPEEVPDCDAAMGVAYGVSVAGNIGARQRFEYTVIGDPVNEAARLCELAKTVPSRLVASSRTVDSADDSEAAHWKLAEDVVTLRGRSEPTRLATPLD